MKRISVLLIGWALCGAPSLRAQDAATEERLNKLAGRIEDLSAGQDTLHKQVQDLARQLEELREQMRKPTGSYASQEDLKRLAESVREVDQKRLDDSEKVRTELLNLRKSLLAAPALKKPAVETPKETTRPDRPEKGFEYVVKSGDRLSTIVEAYRDKNIKVTMDQVLKANPDLKPEKMRVGQKIFIPAPQP